MKISEIINELTELQKYIGDKELEACIANAVTIGVNIMYQNDDGGITSTSLEGEKMARQMKATMSDQEALKVKVVNLNFCEASNDPDLVARADVEVTYDNSSLSINGLDLRYNDATGTYSIVEPKFPSGVCINGFTCRAVTSAVVAEYIKHSDSGKTTDAQASTSTIISNSAESNPPSKPVAFFDHRKETDCTMEYQVYDKQEADAYIHWLEQKAGIL